MLSYAATTHFTLQARKYRNMIMHLVRLTLFHLFKKFHKISRHRPLSAPRHLHRSKPEIGSSNTLVQYTCFGYISERKYLVHVTEQRSFGECVG